MPAAPTRRTALGLLAALPFALPVAAAEDDSPVSTDWRGRAIRGYDAVAYFTEGRPVEGSADHVLRWRGADWRFASADNLARFEADPTAYAPQYGGHCAWAVAQNKKAPVDPTQWRIVDGRLFLNYDAEVQRKWLVDVPGFIAAADRLWPDLAR